MRLGLLDRAVNGSVADRPPILNPHCVMTRLLAHPSCMPSDEIPRPHNYGRSSLKNTPGAGRRLGRITFVAMTLDIVPNQTGCHCGLTRLVVAWIT